jgi:Tfp pilus assembly protein PilF
VRIPFRIIAALKTPPRTVAIFVIIAATFLGYWPALRNGFVWDDTALCLRDPLIRSWVLIPEGFRHFLFLDATASDFYRPLQRLTFTADYQLYSFARPWGWHLTSILIHAAAAVALWAFIRKLSASLPAKALATGAGDWLALGVTVVWAVHPLHTSAVTYIAGRADPLAALCGFGGLALGLASLEKGRRRWLPALAAAGCFFGALLSKEAGVFALLIWFLILAWRRETWRVFAKWLALALLILGCYSALRFTARRTSPPPPPATPLAVRPILAARAVAEYAGLLVAPLRLHMERDVSTHPQASVATTLSNARRREFQTLAGALLFIALLAWGQGGRRMDPLIPLALGAFLVAYLPISNVLSLNATVAEHWLYIPSAFLFLAAARTLAHSRLPRGPAIAVLTVWTLLLGARTFIRQADWRDQRTFTERTIADGGDSPRMRMNLANVESAAGNNELAIRHYRTAIERAPEQPIIWLGYANFLFRARDFSGAREALGQAEKSPRLAAECRRILAAITHLETGTDSSRLLRDALDLEPGNWSIRKQYVEHLIERGEKDEAMRALSDELRTDGFRGESWKLMGRLSESINRPDLAIGSYRKALARDVHDDESRTRIRQLAAASEPRP